MATKAEIEAMKVADLRAKCGDLGLSKTGTKAELAARVLAALGISSAGGEAATPVTAAAPSTPAAEPAAVLSAPPPAAENGASKHGKHAPITFAPCGGALSVAPEPAAVPPTAAQPTAVSTGSKIVSLERKPSAAPAAVVPKTEGDKLLLRAERFGVSAKEVEEEKARRRRERFNMTTEEDKKVKQAKLLEELKGDDEKRKAREAKFGKLPESGSGKPGESKKAGAGGEELAKLVDVEKVRKRAERFGQTTAQAAVLTDDARKKARAERFKAAS